MDNLFFKNQLHLFFEEDRVNQNTICDVTANGNSVEN